MDAECRGRGVGAVLEIHFEKVGLVEPVPDAERGPVVYVKLPVVPPAATVPGGKSRTSLIFRSLARPPTILQFTVSGAYTRVSKRIFVAASGTIGADGCSVSVHVSPAPKLAAKQLRRKRVGSAASHVLAILKSA